MSFAGACAADKNCVPLGVQERAGCQFADLSLIHGRRSAVEAVEIFQLGELGATDPVGDRSGLVMGALGTEQAGNKRKDLLAPSQPLADDLIEAGAHAEEL